MRSNRPCMMRRGFSLIELLIVIIIISLVYFLGFSGISNSQEKAKALTPLNLKSSILKSENFTGKGTLLCINNAKNCYFRETCTTHVCRMPNRRLKKL